MLILKKTVLGEITHLLTHRLPELKPLPSEVVADYKLLNFGHEKQISRIDKQLINLINYQFFLYHVLYVRLILANHKSFLSMLKNQTQFYIIKISNQQEEIKLKNKYELTTLI